MFIPYSAVTEIDAELVTVLDTVGVAGTEDLAVGVEGTETDTVSTANTVEETVGVAGWVTVVVTAAITS